MAKKPDKVWQAVIIQQRHYGLNARQVAELLAREHGIHLSRQAVHSRLLTFRKWHPVAENV